MTNNQAEYLGALLGLSAAKKRGATEVHLIMDSELVIKQLQGFYKVKDENMKILNGKVKDIAKTFEKITYTSVLREKNKLADQLVNEAIDAKNPVWKLEQTKTQLRWC